MFILRPCIKYNIVIITIIYLYLDRERLLSKCILLPAEMI